MYQSIKSYSVNEFQELITSFDSYTDLDKNDMKDCFYCSNLTHLKKLPDALGGGCPTDR